MRRADEILQKHGVAEPGGEIAAPGGYDPDDPASALAHVLEIDDMGKRASQTIRALGRMVTAGMDLAAEAEVRSYVVRKRLLPGPTFNKAIRAARRSARVSQDNPEDANQATQLQALAREHYRMVTAEDGKAYAVPVDGPNVAISLGRQFARQLVKLFLEKTGTAPGAQAVSTAIQILLAYLDGQEPEPVHIRLARYGNAVVLDLGTKDGRCVIVDSSGWRVEERSPVLFRRGVGTPLPEPVRGGDGLARLRNLVNLNEEQFRLGAAWLVASLVPGIPHPILVTRGEQGTAKTTLARIFQRLIDPSHLDPGALPDNEKDLAVRMHNAYVQAFDNTSSIPELLSDALCRATTGGTFAGRMLYSDDEISVLSYLRIIILTTVEAGQLRADLVERMLPLDLDRIEPEKRKTERAVIGDNPDDKPGVFDLLDQGHAAILGDLLDLLSGVLKHIPDVVISHLPRMADFAKILAALDTCQEWKTFPLYSQLVDSETGALVEGNPFAARLMEFMERRGEWEGTATALRRELTAMLDDKEHPPRGWPADATRAGGQLKRMAPSLRVHGIEVTSDREGKGRTRTYKVAKTASAASAASAAHPDQAEQADARADASGAADAGEADRRTLRTLADAKDPASVRLNSAGQSVVKRPADAADAGFFEEKEITSTQDTERNQAETCSGCLGPLDPALVAAGFTSHGPACNDRAPGR
jgi:hypothetical protein